MKINSDGLDATRRCQTGRQRCDRRATEHVSGMARTSVGDEFTWVENDQADGMGYRGPGRAMKRWVKSESMVRASWIPWFCMTTKLRQSTGL